MSKKRPKNLTLPNEATEFLLYTAPGDGVKVEVILNNDTIWLTRQRMGELFGVQRPAITKYLKKLYESGELEENSTGSILEHNGETGQTYPTKYYNLDAVISVGYRVNSTQSMLMYKTSFIMQLLDRLPLKRSTTRLTAINR